jgi:acyl-CoA synthetase (AMP-forming)/AMP-acid ligase II
LVVLAESTGDAPDDETVREIIRAIRLRIRDDHGIACDEVVVGAQGLVLKTTSGKVRRNACREQFVQRESQRVAVDQSLVNVTP